MSTAEFVRLVRQMRAFQVRRSKGEGGKIFDLHLRDLEYRVDDALRKLDVPEVDLFGGQ